MQKGRGGKKRGMERMNHLKGLPKGKGVPHVPTAREISGGKEGTGTNGGHGVPGRKMAPKANFFYREEGR